MLSSTVKPETEETAMGYYKEFVAEPGAKVRLDKIDPACKDKQQSQDKAASDIARNLERLRKGQYLLYADGSQSLLVVLQGLDASGKDGTIQHIFSGVNPLGTKAVRFNQPSARELSHDFLWRVHAESPARGEIAIFNRSHYEDVLVVRVHKLVAKSVWSKRYKQINDFEELLSQNRTRILKFYLHISPEEQLRRFKQRLDDPMRQWKIRESDYSEREYWQKYIKAYQDAISLTSTKYAPWFIIPSNHKWFRNLVISEIVADAMEDMGLKLPPAPSNLDEIQRKYPAAEAAANNHNRAKENRNR
jgi:PPK2 family polyphosphate:nucleotide phosphotransferase